MSVHSNKRGFGLAELMAGMVVSSILALTIGMMLYFIFLNWSNNRGAVELQRDMTIAMDMLSRTIRPSRDSAIGIPISTTIDIGSNRSFYLAGNSLWYDPDRGTPGNEIEIIKDTVTSLEFEKISSKNSVSINIVLQDTLQSMPMNCVIRYRIK